MVNKSPPGGAASEDIRNLLVSGICLAATDQERAYISVRRPSAHGREQSVEQLCVAF